MASRVRNSGMTATVREPQGRRHDDERGNRPKPVLPVPPDDVEKYAYLNRSLPYLFAWLVVGFLFLAGSQVIAEIRIPAALVLAPFTALYVIYQLISLPVNFTGRSFSLSAHRRKVVRWNPHRYPDVDIYLPICGEDPEILENTWHGVAKLIRAYPGRAIAYVLDDGADETARRMAAYMGFTYVVRPNRGWYRKAGNLRYAFAHTRGEFFLILDADFVPRADLFAELLPYFDDPDIAIVQSPQYFRTAPEQTWIERAGSAIQEIFYRSIQVSRDRYGAAICVGTCAIYRRAALEPHGGPHLIAYAEDVHTGLDVHKDGKRLVYVPVNLASGTSPDNIHAFVHQQVRWCTGNIFTVILGRLWTVRMSLLARLSHISGFFYYVSSAVAVFSVPLFPVVLLLFAPRSVRLSNLLLFGPSLWTGMVMYPNWHLSDYRLRDVLPLTIIRGWAHVLAIWDYVRGRTLKWQPSGARVNRVRRLWWSLIIWNGGIAVLWLVLTGYRIEQTHSLQFLIIGVTGLVNASVTVRAIYAMSERGQRLRHAPSPAPYNPKRQARSRNTFAIAFSVLLAAAVTVAAVAVSRMPTSGKSDALPPLHISKPVAPGRPPALDQLGHPILGVYDGGATPSYANLAQWNTAVGSPASLVLYYNGWGESFQSAFAATARSHGAELVVDLDPTGRQNLAQIARGAGDAWLRIYAQQVATYGSPVVIAFAHEMNGNWYPWGYGHQSPGTYVAAWRHVVQLFRDEGASNVTWLWTVNDTGAANSPPLRPWWPGRQWVNWVGIDGYYYYPTDTFAKVFGQTIAQIRTFTDSPVLIAETAVGTTSDRETQIKALLAGARADDLLGLIWFDEKQNDGIYHQDWRLEDDLAALAEFRYRLKNYLAKGGGYNSG
jgi:cellulose synthase (UDP-forming)